MYDLRLDRKLTKSMFAKWDKETKDWVVNAIASLVVVDQVVESHEMVALQEAIELLDSRNEIENLMKMIKQKKMKAFSNFAYKGFVGAVAGIYLILFGLSFWNIYSFNNQLKGYQNVLTEHDISQKQLAKVNKELKKMTATLKLSNTLKSNKDLSYRILAQIASSVPNRVKFDSVDYDGKRQVVITGIAAGDNDILQLIRNLQSKSLIKQASLSSMKMPNAKAGQQIMKGFKVFVKVNG